MLSALVLWKWSCNSQRYWRAVPSYHYRAWSDRFNTHLLKVHDPSHSLEIHGQPPYGVENSSAVKPITPALPHQRHCLRGSCKPKPFPLFLLWDTISVSTCGLTCQRCRPSHITEKSLYSIFDFSRLEHVMWTSTLEVLNRRKRFSKAYSLI